MNKLHAYYRLMRIDRPIGIFLLVWPTMWALWLAGEGNPDNQIVIIFLVGAFIMRAAGCVINDYADKEYDMHVTRTKYRPITSGEISSQKAIILFIFLLFLALCLVCQLNQVVLVIALFAVLITSIYPFSKRFIYFPQFFLGIAFSLGILMAYSSITNDIPNEAWKIFFANFFWIIAYDTQYAMADRSEDLAIGIKSTAILFGQFDNLIVGLLQGAALTMLILIGLNRKFSWIFYLSIGLAGSLFIYQHSLCKHRTRGGCLRAFSNNHWFGVIVFFGIVLSFIELH